MMQELPLDGHGGAKLDTVLNVNESPKPVTVCDTWNKVPKTIQAPKAFAVPFPSYYYLTRPSIKLLSFRPRCLVPIEP